MDAAGNERRVVAVSGGSAGIGRAVAEAFAARGCAVAIGARRAEPVRRTVEALRAAGAATFGGVLDVTDPASIDAFYAGVEASLGPAGCVVNCAAHARPGSLCEQPPDEIRGEIETGLIGALLFSRRGIAAMLEHRLRGDVVFVSSTSASRPWPFLTAYAASKAGVEQAARSLSLELEGHGIRALAVRVGDTVGTEWAARWEPAELATTALWQGFGLLRHGGLLRPAQVAEAVVTGVSAPRGVQLDFVSVQPEAPVEDPSAG